MLNRKINNNGIANTICNGLAEIEANFSIKTIDGWSILATDLFFLSVNIVHSVSQCQWCIGTMWINTDCTRPGVHHRAWADNQHRLHQVSCRMTKRQRWGWSTMHLLLLWVGHPSGCHYLSLLMTSWPSLPCSPSQVALTSRRSFLSDQMDFSFIFPT